MASVTAALIALDEEAHIGPCLASLKSLVTEIVVVDTGSVDRTPEIAARMGARVLAVPWCDDFAYARNAGLAEASGEWVLYVDADERVDAHGGLDAILAEPEAVAARVKFRASSHVTPYWEHRLFRNRPDIRFRGVIHETVLPDIRAIVDRGAGKIVDAPLLFRHLGYEGDLTAKHRRNLPLLRRAVVDDPMRVYLWHALGEAALGLNDRAGAEIAWRRGLAVVRECGPRPGDARLYSDLIALHLSETGFSLPDAADLVEEARQRHPDDPLVLWWTARFSMSEGRFAEARVHLGRLLVYGPDGPIDGKLGYDRRLFEAYAWALLGVCWLREDEPERAAEWLRRAEQTDRSNLEIRVKRAFAEAVARARAPTAGCEGGATPPSP
jgi:tetratricopeptide (TPR) repeat protein